MKSTRQDTPVRSEINVTPLVDVCLVLLIIFMVVTPLVGNGCSVKLPQTNAPRSIPETSEQLTVSLDAEGRLFLGETPVAAASLVSLLSDAHDRTPSREVRLRADRSLSYSRVRQVMA